MATEQDLDQQIIDNTDESVKQVAERSGLSRRKFTRNVLVGSAVLLTLSNRSAWGTKELICASASLLESRRKWLLAPDLAPTRFDIAVNFTAVMEYTFLPTW